MKVFLSWSGSRSKETAEILGTWLRRIINAVDPWISSKMEKGARWGLEITDKLEESKVGIICLTRKNLDEPWILFEAGALSKTKDAHVCTFLLDISSEDIKPPLAQFQHTQFEKEDVRRLVHTINREVKEIGERPLPEEDLNELFDILWPHLEEKLSEIAGRKLEVDQPVRSDREIQREILEHVRTLRQQESVDKSLPSYHEISRRLFEIEKQLFDKTKQQETVENEVFERIRSLHGTSSTFPVKLIAKKLLHKYSISEIKKAIIALRNENVIKLPKEVRSWKDISDNTIIRF